MKISTRIILSVTAATAITVFAIIFYVANRAKDLQNDVINNDLKNTARFYSTKVNTLLGSAMTSARTLSAIFEQKDEIPVDMRRNLINSYLKGILMQNTDFQTVWTCWEPNTLDKSDSEYINTAAHDSTGRFIPYWYRINDTIKVEQFKDYETEGAGNAYLRTKNEDIEVVTNPYVYEIGNEKIPIISLAVPVRIDGEFVGAVGIDINMQVLQNELNNITIYETGYGFLISGNADMITHKDSTLLGKSFYDNLTEEKKNIVKKAIENNEIVEFDNKSPYTNKVSSYVCSPVTIGTSEDTWMFVVSVPNETLQAGINTMNAITYTAALIALLIIALIAWFSGRIIQVNIKKTLTEVGKLIDAGTKGDLSYRADINKVHNDFQPVIVGFNEVLDTIVNPLNKSVEAIQRISDGDVSKKIEENYKGDFNNLKNNINNMIDVVQSLTGQMNEMYKKQAAGDYEYFMNDTVFKGVYQQVAQGYNQVVKLHIDNILAMLDIVGKFGEGNFDTKMPDLPGKQILVTQVVNGVRTNLLELTEALNQMYKEQAAGDFEYFIDINSFKGTYKEVADSYNSAVKLHVDNIMAILDIVGKFGEGNFDTKMPDLPGKQILATQVVNGVRDNLLSVTSEISNVTNAISSGNMSAKGNSAKYKGEYAKIIDGLNASLNALVEPLGSLVRELSNYTREILNGNLSAKLTLQDSKIGAFQITVKSINSAFAALIKQINTSVNLISEIARGDIPDEISGIYKGDFQQLQESLNGLIVVNQQIINHAQKIADGNLKLDIQKRSDKDELMIAFGDMVLKLSKLVDNINDAADNVASGSAEISNNASSMAQGANEQASSVEEVSASVEEMEATISQNSENAKNTKEIAEKAAQNIEVGSKAVQSTVEAMRQIIEKIQIVTEIADKTDLLAINAAIEAARAGEHGEGFAVVAGEVRKLAEISKEAAKEINNVSKQSLRTAEQSGGLLKGIVPQIHKTSQLINDIAIASNEQNSGINQITSAINQLNQLSQQNAASAEELSTGSEELNTQADVLRETISFFKTNTKQNSNLNKKETPTKKMVTNGINISLEKTANDDEYSKF